MPPQADAPRDPASHESLASAVADAATRRCRNCGAAAPGNYCPHCGQETTVALPTVPTLLREAAGRYLPLDGRLLRTLQALLFRPGYLTLEYLSGRRRRYVRPARLFFALSIVVFAALQFSSEPVVIVDRDSAKPAAQPSPGGEAQARSEDMGVQIDPDFNLSLGQHRWSQFEPLRRRVDAFNRLSREEKSRQLSAGALRYAPYAAVGLLPLFALLLKIVYAGRGRRHPSRPRRYAAHLVFGAHIHAFLFLTILLSVLIDVRAVRLTLIAWMVVYALAAMKVVYGGGWFGTVGRALLIAFAYLMFFGLAVAAVLVAAVALR